MMQGGGTYTKDSNTHSKEYGELANPVDHFFARYVIKSKRAMNGDGDVVRAIIARGPNGITHLFGASPEKAALLLDELMESGGKREVLEFIKAADKNGNTALFGANPETAEVLIARLYEAGKPSDIWDFIIHKNKEEKTAIECSGPGLATVIREASTKVMQRIHNALRI
jgi:hypothetical protein